jgi:predicted 2-oxoglutarate/Fe(II)-dependent dioxygenase YbiX
MVGYLNDDYEGGGLRFDKIDLEVKPRAGDLYIFPSSYLFSHSALPVKSGTKYSVVTMTDYNDATHTQEFYRQFKSSASEPE